MYIETIPINLICNKGNVLFKQITMNIFQQDFYYCGYAQDFELIMALLRATRFLLVMIPLISAAGTASQRRGAPIAPTFNSDPVVYSDLQEALDYESGYSTTEFPYSDYETTSVVNDESSFEETTEEIMKETEIIVDSIAAGHFNLSKESNARLKPLIDLFYETNSVEQLDMEQCEQRLRNDERKFHGCGNCIHFIYS